MDLENVLLPQHDKEKQFHGGQDLVAPKAAEILGYAPRGPLREELPRPASYTSVPKLHETGNLAFSFSEDDLVPTTTSWLEASNNSSHDRILQDEGLHRNPALSLSNPGPLPDRKITVQRAMQRLNRQHTKRPASPQRQTSSAHQTQMPYDHAQESNNTATLEALSMGKTLTKSFSLGRRAKLSRSASRSPRHTPKTPDADVTSSPGKAETSTLATIQDIGNDSPSKDENSLESSSFPSKRVVHRRSKKPRTEQEHFESKKSSPSEHGPSNTMVNSDAPSFTGLNVEDWENVPALPNSASIEKVRLLRERKKKRKDSFESAFRKLDIDYSKYAIFPLNSLCSLTIPRFNQKSLSLKASVIQTSLISFIRSPSNHASSSGLHPEELERRTSVLKKWWDGLLDLLQGKDYNHISGSDRPVFLEAILGIMERKEWRYPPSLYSPIHERNKHSGQSQINEAALQASESESDGFYLESVHHSVRNSFVQNLFKQMTFVVERMSQKQAPASVTTFCGKTCAYAFFFCPGIAEVLVRQWKLTKVNMRRVLHAASISPEQSIKSATGFVNTNFPPYLHGLSFTSLKENSSVLRDTPAFSISFNKLNFHGCWQSRWTGRESELFYVFVRVFHYLMLDFLPPNLSSKDRLCAPALVYVRTQMLVNLASTLRRFSDPRSQEQSSKSNPTFDDLLAENISAPQSSLASTTSPRMHPGDRLISILDDFTLTRLNLKRHLPQLLAESFNQVIKAAARSISLYDQNSCFALCDFLEDAFPKLIHLNRDPIDTYQSFEWSFWVDVFGKMVTSYSVQTETKLYSLIFALWSSLDNLPGAKKLIGESLLLERPHFQRTFCHWSPPVRAYFMRLLCWRLARCDGDASEDDVSILQSLMVRLQEVWDQHRILDDQARSKGSLRPSTAPCNILRDRKLLIIRTDTPISTTLLTFEDVAAAVGDKENHPLFLDQVQQPLAASILDRVTAGFESGMDISRKGGSLIRSMFGSRSIEIRSRSESPRPRKESPRSSPETSRSSSPDRATSRRSLYEHGASRTLATAPRNNTTHTSASQTPKLKGFHGEFKFSVEAAPNSPDQMYEDMELESPRLPLAAQLLLQSTYAPQTDHKRVLVSEQWDSTVRYAGRALAEWTLVVNECQNFFERRRSEGVPSNRQVETPTLIAEIRPKAL